MTIKALSLWDPWATAMMLGLKKVETRGWYMHYRGPLVIHVARSTEGLHTAQRSPLREFFEDSGYGVAKPWPLGCVVCVVDVIDCQPTHILAPSLTVQELAFGDYRRYGDDGKQRYGIVTANVRVFPKPLPWKGAQGLWDYGGPLPEGVKA